jgi:hypothetical protein
MKKMKANIVEDIIEYGKNVIYDSLPLTEIRFYKNGIQVIIPKEVIEKFKKAGLNMLDILLMDTYINEIE